MTKRTAFEAAVLVEGDVADLDRAETELLLTALQAELDGIARTFGMQARRVALKQRRDELLDRLLALRGAGV